MGTNPGDPCGLFIIPERASGGRALKVIASDGSDGESFDTGWEHVSVSLAQTHKDSPRCPSWQEMCAVKALFWEGEDCVVQFHPPESEYVNIHQGVLHLWRWRQGAFPQPPQYCV